MHSEVRNVGARWRAMILGGTGVSPVWFGGMDVPSMEGPERRQNMGGTPMPPKPMAMKI